MKNTLRHLGIIALVAVIGFSFAACGGGSTAHTHSWGDWRSNTSQHWKECSCGEEYGRASHTFSGVICSVCNYNSSTGGQGTTPTVTTTSLPNGTVGTAYSQTLAVAGATPITWSIDSGALPNGLTLSAAGVISGTPATANTFTFTVKATNAAGSGTKSLSITIATTGGGDLIFTSIADFRTWLNSQSTNNASNPYNVRINISNLDGSPSLRDVLRSSTNNKYVNIDLSGSTFTSIAASAFSSCTTLTGVTIGSSVTSIGNSAFNACTNLTSVTIGNNVTSIGSEAFNGCTSLTIVTFTATSKVTSIGASAFSGCTILNNVTIPNSVTIINTSAFRNCTNLTSIIIPNSVTSMNGQGIFYGCTNLASITLGSGVTKIEGYVFTDCTNLTSVTFLGTITTSDFSISPGFTGDLRAKYLAANGGPGTYTKSGTTWTKQ